jgi:hypothetical protein
MIVGHILFRARTPMKLIAKTFVLLWLLGLSWLETSPVSAATPCDLRDALETHWHLVSNANGVSIYQPRHKNSLYPSAVVRVRWDSSPQALYQRIWRYERFPEFIDAVTSSRILQADNHQVWVYQTLRFPNPVRDRHYVMRSTDAESEPLQSHYRVEWELSEQYPVPEQTDLVRPEVFRGCWDIRRAARRGLDAVYWIEFDAGGLLPRWMVSIALRSYLTDLMNALRSDLHPSTRRGK